MGLALTKPDNSVTRQRPNKVLRVKTQRTGNLCVYPRSATVQVSEKAFTQNRTKAYSPVDSAIVHTKPSQQPLNKRAANSASAFIDSKSWLAAAPKKQLYLSVVGCLFAGTVAGYQWPTFTHQSLSLNSAISAKPVAAEKPMSNIGTTTVPNAVSASTRVAATIQASTPTLREQQYLETQAQYRSDIEWLQGQNNELQTLADSLNLESFNQIQELLELELEVFSLRSKAEPPTETRVVYNFTNEPGAASQYQDQNTSEEVYNDQEEVDSEDEEQWDEDKEVEWDENRPYDDYQENIVYDPVTGEPLIPD